jgi:hypothetical protein
MNLMILRNYSDFRLLQLVSIWLLLFYPQPCVGQAGASSLKVYRGVLADKHVEMRLKIDGGRASGTYSYDQFKQDLQLKGAFGSAGQLELTETGPKNKPTGKFVCKKELEVLDIDLECEWTRPDGTGKATAIFKEQFVDFHKGFQLVPTTISNRPLQINASYPQLTAVAGTSSTSITAFNSRIESLAQKEVKSYSQEPIPSGSFDMNYNVMLGTDDLVSIEINQEFCCGAHPAESVSAVTYDLSSNKELVLDELFKPGSDYKTAIAAFVVSDINKRAEQIEQAEANREGRKVEKRQEPFTTDSLPEMSSWAITPKGIAVYFDFSHAMAVFTKTIVPFSVLREHLKADGPIARFIH